MYWLPFLQSSVESVRLRLELDKVLTFLLIQLSHPNTFSIYNQEILYKLFQAFANDACCNILQQLSARIHIWGSFANASQPFITVNVKVPNVTHLQARDLVRYRRRNGLVIISEAMGKLKNRAVKGLKTNDPAPQGWGLWIHACGVPSHVKRCSVTPDRPHNNSDERIFVDVSIYWSRAQEFLTNLWSFTPVEWKVVTFTVGAGIIGLDKNLEGGELPRDFGAEVLWYSKGNWTPRLLGSIGANEEMTWSSWRCNLDIELCRLGNRVAKLANEVSIQKQVFLHAGWIEHSLLVHLGDARACDTRACRRRCKWTPELID